MEESWSQFRSFLSEKSPRQFKDLNGPCTDAKIAQAEGIIQQVLHASLKALYRLNDGQGGHEDGIFPSEETMCRFLPLIEAAFLWESFKTAEDLDVFEVNLIPFAHDGVFDAYCLHSATGSVFFLQTGGPDPFLPRSWQTTKIEINSSLEEFFHEMLIRISQPYDYLELMKEKAVKGKTRDSRVQAVEYLGKSKSPAASKTLLKVLAEDQDHSVRFFAVIALSRIGGDNAIQGLVTAIEQDPDSGVRIESVRMLYQLKYPKLAPIIIDLLQKEQDFWQRYDLAKILGKLAKKNPVPAADVIPILTRDLESLEDTNSLKFALAIALFRLEGPQGTASNILNRMKTTGVLADYQVAKLGKAVCKISKV